MFASTVNWQEELLNIKEQGANGVTMSELAQQYQVSRQRMKQVIDRYIPEWKDHNQLQRDSSGGTLWNNQSNNSEIIHKIIKEKFLK